MNNTKLTLLSAMLSSTLFTGLSMASETATEPLKMGVQSTHLRILLTNDDGWNAPGIRAAYAALTKAGHIVTVVAPSNGQSGSGARKTYWGKISAVHPDLSKSPEYKNANVWSVGPVKNGTTAGEGSSAVPGSPADSVLFGLSSVFENKKPDLVIAGTNSGQNTGSTVSNSGTFGAALEAAKEGIPAIAISQEIGGDYDVNSTETPDFGHASAYLVNLVRALINNADQNALLPQHTVLNVNYPRHEAKGTKYTSLATKDSFTTSYAQKTPGIYEIGYSFTGDKENTETDVGALLQGYAAVTLIDSSYGVPPATGWNASSLKLSK
ncbi:5'/3'-nucleotidase SurE [Pseudomonas sp. TH31]|uniref:5'/3'-nucleotidase SurE n=1 Tax=Pseudomonas sp. TH31 TaxID=2796396 RepID=UPI00191283F4|nr:5'/3'-nucleotidase SurE [Pseudomonas sp. TH31]MBK5413275.1 5'/3'-nucleotidase SurE [Pseudomonas sp. TH31]